MEASIPTVEEIAHHEAGHAVIAYRLGHYCYGATIVPDDISLGIFHGEGSWHDRSRDADCVVRCYAGFAAQRKYRPDANRGCSATDDADAEEFLLANPELSGVELQQKTDDIVSLYWSEIHAVATALLEGKTLDGDQITTICEAVADGEDWREWLAYRTRFNAA